MFYIIESQDHEWVGRISYPDSGWGLDFNEGQSIDPHFGDGNIIVEFEADHDSLPDYFEIDGTPIVSEKFVRAWKDLPLDNYQLFPVKVKFPKSQRVGYSILNVVGLVSCMDLAASDCQMYENSVMRILNLVLDLKVTDIELFRSQEYPLAIFISESIHQKLEKANLSGMLIKPADGWNDLHRF